MDKEQTITTQGRATTTAARGYFVCPISPEESAQAQRSALLLEIAKEIFFHFLYQVQQPPSEEAYKAYVDAVMEHRRLLNGLLLKYFPVVMDYYFWLVDLRISCNTILDSMIVEAIFAPFVNREQAREFAQSMSKCIDFARNRLNRGQLGEEERKKVTVAQSGEGG